MTTFLLVAFASFVSYYIGRKVGIAYAMMRMQGIIYDMQQIEMLYKQKQQKWNEDKL